MSTSNRTIGYLVQLGGIAGIVAGTVLSLHHIAIALCFAAGAAAFYIGKKIRAVA